MSKLSASTAAMLARKFVMKNAFDGMPKLTDFELVEEHLPNELHDGEILVKAEWLTVDPYMRLRSKPGEQMIGTQVGRVIKSKCSEFPEGSQVVGGFGWRDLTIYKPTTGGPRIYNTIHKLPDLQGLPVSYALGAVGMPGNTAYFGLTELCRPKPGDTLVVTAAAGAVGSAVCQIGKLKGCKVIAFAGTDDKLKWLTEELGADHAFNYKGADLDKIFKTYAPDGIDCYFDNVAGEFNYHVVRNMKQSGRIAQCGSISTYNAKTGSIPMVPFDYPTFRMKRVKMEGFQVNQWHDRWFEGLNQLRDWIVNGKLKVHETVTDGFLNMPQAFIDLLNGKNIGKQIVKA